VPNFQRNLRRELLKHQAAQPASALGPALWAAVGCALLCATLLVLFVAKPELPTRLNAALSGSQPTRQAAESPESGPTNIRAGQTVAADDMVLRDLLSDKRFSVDTDRAIVDEWMAQRFPTSKIGAQPVGNEGILAVRQFRTQTGQRILVYTQLSEDSETVHAY